MVFCKDGGFWASRRPRVLLADRVEWLGVEHSEPLTSHGLVAG